MVNVPPPIGAGRAQVKAADNEDRIMAQQDAPVEPPEQLIDVLKAEIDTAPPAKKPLGLDKAIASNHRVLVAFANGEDDFILDFDSEVNAREFYQILSMHSGGLKKIKAVELQSLAGVYTLEAGVGKPQWSIFGD